jgi:two-component system chemotaxis sensor kinase CheA
MDEVRLDALLDTIGELVIAESVVSSATRSHADEVTLLGQLERLDKITRELQQMATSLRMVPMRSTFRRMARLVRDLAHGAGKQVDFVTRGEDAELDKTVVDRIEDPLIHALRNAVDHGIETAEERVAAGKSPVARIELRAFHAGGSIHVEVSDDGRGLDLDRIFAKAITVGLVEAAERPSDDRLSELVFAPGFSTADAVTDVSGRGVGMDVVRRTVEELRGRIRLQTAPSGGTTVSMRLPVTLAIIDGMVIRVCDARYVVPTLSVVRSVRPEAGDITRVLGTGEVLQVADGLLRLVRLRSLFSLSTGDDEFADSIVMIVESDSGQVGLVVDEIVGQQQIVIKPLGTALGDVAGVSGGAVMPDGQVGLILDVEELVMVANEG